MARNSVLAEQHFTKLVTLKLVKETRGALRYAEVNDDGQFVQLSDPGVVFGTIYIRKAALGYKKTPDEILVKVTGT